MKQTIFSFKNAEAQYLRYSMKEKKRQSVEKQEMERVKRRKESLSWNYTVGSIASKTVQMVYVNKMED